MSKLHCWNCCGNMEETEVEFDHEYKGETFTITTKGLICHDCGWKSLQGKHMDEYNIKLADAYRNKHGLLTTDEILNMRNRLKLDQQGFADLLYLSIRDINRIEHGMIQSQYLDSLIRHIVKGR